MSKTGKAIFQVVIAHTPNLGGRSLTGFIESVLDAPERKAAAETLSVILKAALPDAESRTIALAHLESLR